MSIYGKCKVCGHETKDYECANCMRGKLFALEAVAGAARFFLRAVRHSPTSTIPLQDLENLERALGALDREEKGQDAE